MADELLSYENFVKLVLDALQAAGLEYLIGGAVATWAWGEPRGTLDLDIVVNIPLEAASRLSQALQERDMLVPPDVILDAILETRADLPINAIHLHSGYKADLYPLRDGDELRALALQRRRHVDLGPPLGEVYLHAPEDLILYKLWFFSLSQQTKHIRDITTIVLSVGAALDEAYIDGWAERKGLSSLWQALLSRIRSG